MKKTTIQRWDEMWMSPSGINGADLAESQDNTPASWEETVNSALARMLEGADPVQRAIAARLLLAESYLGRLYRDGPDEVNFASRDE
jgi:hypothetical protein